MLRNRLNAKTTEIEGKIPSTASLATTVAPNLVENKTPNVNDLAKN